MTSGLMQGKFVNWSKTLRVSAKAMPIRAECCATCRTSSTFEPKKQILVRQHVGSLVSNSHTHRCWCMCAEQINRQIKSINEQKTKVRPSLLRQPTKDLDISTTLVDISCNV